MITQQGKVDTTNEWVILKNIFLLLLYISIDNYKRFQFIQNHLFYYIELYTLTLIFFFFFFFSQNTLEHLEADLGARTERLKVAGPGMDFAARGAARRELMEQKEQFEVLTGHVRAVRIERDNWREHIQFHGYNPDAVSLNL